MRAYEIVSDGGIDALALADRPTPAPGHGEVLVKMHASSLNYRDLLTVLDPRGRNLPYPRIPNSDGAGEVLAVGEGVRRFKPGDRVAGCFFQRWEDGDITADGMASALGGTMDGVLAEEVVLSERGLVRIPAHLSYAEAATLPCAALTAWNALVEKGRLMAGETVLLIGTGGVSIFGLQIAAMHGARSVIISSSDEKLERARAMGAWGTVNYRATPDWQHAVLDLTDGRGVDHVLEVGGAGTLPRSIASTRVAGHIALIGVLTGGEINPALIFRNSLRVSGIYVGSRAMFERMNRAFEAAELRPVLDRTFAFEDARAAFHHLQAAGHFGKVVIAG
ncbi:MAG: NAD(P)-dependent alcohol dehydrogenase [Alphaproteobacteria bacterium]|nr:NAD(P)-dependent alcohol dehydrogenase [Alphaproteobacteria bacterium]MCB9931308.1 NAD(P)-dependent alcohol dehydrogenase [Alphaproteobacteria bacterium]